MSEVVEIVKEQKKRKMRLRRTQDLISQEVLFQDRQIEAKKSIKKAKRRKRPIFLPQVNDLFDSGVNTSPDQDNILTVPFSKNEIDFKKPVVDKRVKAIKTTFKVNCTGQSWLVQPFTDASSSSDSTKEDLFKDVVRNKSFKKMASSSLRKKPKINILENIQVRPCFVLLDKLQYDANDKLEDESFKFHPSNSSSPFISQNVSDLRVKDRKSSLTKEMFEELPNWSRSDYWDVEVIVDKTKAAGKSNGVLNIENATSINRPSLNSAINLSTSRKLLKNSSICEIEKPVDVSQRKNSILLSSEKRKTFDVEDIIDTTKAHINSTYELNGSSMNGRINQSTSKKSLKNNSTFDIEKPLDFSRTKPQRKSTSLNPSLNAITKPTDSVQRKTFEVEDAVNGITGKDGFISVSNVTNSMLEMNRRSTNSSVNLTTSKSSLKNNSTFEIEKPLDTSQPQRKNSIPIQSHTTMTKPTAPELLSLGGNSLTDSAKRERKKWVILEGNQRSLSRQSLSESSANVFLAPTPFKRRTIGEFSTKLEGKKSSILDRGKKLFIFGQKSSEVLQNPEKRSDESFSKPEENEILSKPSRSGVTNRRRSTLTLDDTVNDIEVLMSGADVFESPKQLQKCEEQSAEGTTKKRRCVTFSNDSVIIIEDSDTSFEQGEDNRSDSFMSTSIRSPKNDSLSRFRRRISSDSTSQFLYKKSIGLNHKIATDDVAVANKNPVSASKSNLKKVPNFAKIHQKMFDKMLNIKDYSEKKKERAKLLLSGNKLPKQNEKILPVFTKKELFPSTKSNLITSTPKVVKKVIGYNRFGFKAGLKDVDAKQEQIKAVANKMPPIKNPSKQRFKEELKGVRSNKRFELLMKFRQK